MTIRNILVHLDGPEAIGGLVPAVEQLAVDLGAGGLTVAVAGHVPVPVTGASLTLALVHAREHDMLDVVDGMRGRVTAMLHRIPFEWRSAVSPLAQTLMSRWAVRSDLVVTSSSPGHDQPLGALDVGALVIAAGRPVLIVPRLEPKLRFERVLIGFKSTREGRAALAAAVPLLGGADRVLVVTIGATTTGEELADAESYLREQGVAVDTRTIEDVADADAGRLLLELATDDGSDLLVTGAYGRSRAREFIFGGATRTLLSEARIPCLLVH